MNGYVLSRKSKHLGLEAWVAGSSDFLHIYFVSNPVKKTLRDYWRPNHPDLVLFLRSRDRRRVYLVTATTPPCLVVKM